MKTVLEVEQKDDKSLNISIEGVDLLNHIKESIQAEIRRGEKVSSEIKLHSGVLLSIEDVCQMFGKSRQTVHSWRKKGIIPFHTMGVRVYFKKEELLDSLRKVDLSK